MNISLGIVGLPNVGKSTLFNALTEKGVPAENYPFCTIDPSVGIVAVPDPRLKVLTEMSKSAKTIPAAIEFVDIAGLVKGAAEGAGLGNAFLAHIKQTDAILEVVRIFEDADVIHVEEGKIDPVRDIGIINLELILSDMSNVATRLASVERDAARGDKAAIAEKEALLAAQQLLEAGRLLEPALRGTPFADALKGLQLITMKPILYVLNKKAGGHNLDEANDERWHTLLDFMTSTGSQYVVVDAGIEGELRSVAGDDRDNLRREFGVLDDGIDNLIRAGYRTLGLMTYFTTGEDETRAWTVPIGATGPQAGAAIHSDFEDKFIRAEVVSYENLVNSGSYTAAKEKGLVRTEGKEYIVKDGDVIEFKI